MVLVQDCSISIAKALEILQSCTKPPIWYCIQHNNEGKTLLRQQGHSRVSPNSDGKQQETNKKHLTLHPYELWRCLFFFSYLEKTDFVTFFFYFVTLFYWNRTVILPLTLLTLPTSCMSCSWRSCDNVWCLRASCNGVSPSLSGRFKLHPARTNSCTRDKHVQLDAGFRWSSFL